MPKLHVRRISDNSIVHSVETTPSRAEKVMMGMLRNMDRDNFFVDDSEFDEKETE